MSTLDQAFIRAYQGGRTRAPESPAPAAKTRVPEVAPAPAEEASAKTKAAKKTTRRDTAHVREPATVALPPGRLPAANSAPPVAVAVPTAAPTHHYVDAAHTGVPTHYRDSVPRAAIAAAPQAGRAADAIREQRYESESAVAAAVEPPEVATHEAPTEEFRAAFETPRFAWPRQVEVLIAAAGNDFGEFAAELEQRIAAGRRTLAVTGVERGEGRTTILLALARLLANRGLRTALVDLDLRMPQLAEQLGIRPELGWDDAVAERLGATDAMIESMHDRITLLPMRNALANPRALAGNTALAAVIGRLREHFDAVLLDVGPLADDQQAIDTAAALSGVRLDDALVVRDRRRTGAKEVQEVCRRLTVLGVHHWDIAENFSEVQGY